MSSESVAVVPRVKHASRPSVAVVPRVKHASRPSGADAYAKAVRKYNLDTPSFYAHNGVIFKRHAAATDAHTKEHRGLFHHFHRQDPPRQTLFSLDRSMTEVSTKDIQTDSEYVVPVTIGTPGVTLNLDFDTGSSDLWVWSSESNADKIDHSIYVPSKSSTAEQLQGASWEIHYGDKSSASGNVYTDVVRIGSLTINHQAIELAETVSEQFKQRTGDDGFLGLAWPMLNTVKPHPVATPVENIMKQNSETGIFSVALDKGDDHGFYTFGGFDAARAGVDEARISYINVDNSNGFWQVPAETVSINGKAVYQSGNTAILDTGTTLCLVSHEVTEAIYKHIPGSQYNHDVGGWVYPSDAHVPEIVFSLGKYKYTLNKEDFVFQDLGNNTIYGGIQERGDGRFDILGDVFLKSAYVIFDQRNVKVGVAQRSGNVEK